MYIPLMVPAWGLESSAVSWESARDGLGRGT